MNHDLVGIWKQALWRNLRRHLEICQKGLREMTETLGQDSPCALVQIGTRHLTNTI